MVYWRSIERTKKMQKKKEETGSMGKVGGEKVTAKKASRLKGGKERRGATFGGGARASTGRKGDSHQEKLFFPT